MTELQKKKNISMKITNNTKKNSYDNCSHFWNIFLKMYKHIFKVSSYIQKMTPNPINALKITIHNTKHTTKYKNTCPEIQKKQKNLFENSKNKKPLLYYISKFHNAYFVYFVYFVYYIYIYIYIYTRIRVGPFTCIRVVFK